MTATTLNSITTSHGIFVEAHIDSKGKTIGLIAELGGAVKQYSVKGYWEAGDGCEIITQRNINKLHKDFAAMAVENETEAFADVYNS